MPRCSTAAVACLLVSAVVTPAADCTQTVETPGLGRFYSHSWGFDAANTRFQPPSRTAINGANARSLELKWVYALASALSTPNMRVSGRRSVPR